MECCRVFSLIVILIVLTKCSSTETEGKLNYNFYRSSCPNVQNIVRKAVSTKFTQTHVTAQGTLRLFFHDCFIQGCDASIMISSHNRDAEKDAEDNMSLPGDGFDAVIKAKQAVEAVCPRVVSCADILALATRDVIVLAGGPSFTVELGRRDSLRSSISDVQGSLPGPGFNLNQLIHIFAKNNLTQTDMMALSGAHTLGVSHCTRLTNRIYNYSKSHPMDPTLDPTYARQLIQECPREVLVDPIMATIAVPMDPVTPEKFDNQYYKNLMVGKGMFGSDQALFTNRYSRETVVKFAENQGEFYDAFVYAMKKLGRAGVKTGYQGEIRRDCAAFN